MPVIADFGGLALSGDNLALDTATAWQLGGGKLKGTNPHTLYGTEDIAGGTTVTVSFDYDITGLTFGTVGYIVVCGSPYFRSMEMSRRFAANGSGHSKATVTLGSTVASQKKEIGTRIKTVSVTGAASDAHVRITNFKVEKGPYETPWRPNARDYSYIAEALRQGGSMEAGIVLTRLLQLGYTDASGTFRTTAGMVDAAKVPVNGAASAWRHDGTGYAAHNTVRFKERTVELGEGMVLDDRELALLDEDSSRKLVISRESVGVPFVPTPASGMYAEYEARGQVVYEARTAGTLAVSVRIRPTMLTAVLSQEKLSVGALITVDGSLGRKYSSLTKIGSDGLVSVWPNSAMLITEESFIARVGNYGIRIDPENGIRINRGNGWVDL